MTLKIDIERTEDGKPDFDKMVMQAVREANRDFLYERQIARRPDFRKDRKAYLKEVGERIINTFKTKMEEISKIPGYNERKVLRSGIEMRKMYELEKERKKRVDTNEFHSKDTRTRKKTDIIFAPETKKEMKKYIENFLAEALKKKGNRPKLSVPLESARYEGNMKHKMIRAEKLYLEAKKVYQDTKNAYGGKFEAGLNFVDEIKAVNEKKQQLLEWVSELEKLSENEVKQILIDGNVELIGVVKESIENMSLEDVMKKLREEIDNGIEDEIKNIEEKEGYQEGVDAVKRVLSLEDKMLKAKEKYQDAREKYKDAQMAYRGRVIETRKEELYGDKEKILKSLKDYVRTEPAEVEGYKGKYVYITLPRVGKFKGFRFKYFVSNKTFRWYDIRENPKLQEKSHSLYSSQKLLGKIREYMKEMGVVIDKKMDYTKDLSHWEDRSTYWCEAGDCLKYLTGLNGLCLLKDRKEKRYTSWFLGYKYNNGSQMRECEFYRDMDDYNGNVYYLFLE